MSADRAYETPAAFRRALTDRLKKRASEGPWTLPQLQRQIAYDRLLERLYLVDQGWVVKGATALLARQIGVRGTKDIDLYREAAPEVAEDDLRRASQADLGDWFRFELGSAQPVGEGDKGVRVPVTAYIGGTVWMSFRVDLLGAELRMTGEPEPVPPLARVMMPTVAQHGYRAYPLVDHVADKIAAMYERYGTMQRPSTRFRDLVDLVAIVTEASLDAERQLIALGSETERRGITLAQHFDVPDRQLWERGYAAAARDSILASAQTLDEALAVVGPFAGPLLQGTAAGSWDPSAGRWTG